MRHHIVHSIGYILSFTFFLMGLYVFVVSASAGSYFYLTDEYGEPVGKEYEYEVVDPVYKVGDDVIVRIFYCSEKAQDVYGRLILKDTYDYYGEAIVMPVDEGCGSRELTIEIPDSTYPSRNGFTVHGILNPQVNSLKQGEIAFYTNNFQIDTTWKDYFGKTSDEPLFK